MLPQQINSGYRLSTLPVDSKFFLQSPDSRLFMENTILNCLQCLLPELRWRNDSRGPLKGNFLATQSFTLVSGWITEKRFHLAHLIFTPLRITFPQTLMAHLPLLVDRYYETICTASVCHCSFWWHRLPRLGYMVQTLEKFFRVSIRTYCSWLKWLVSF